MALPASIPIVVANIAERAAAADRGEATAVGFRGGTHSYADLWGMAGAFASGLDAAGVDPGDGAGIYLPNLPQFVVAFHGTLPRAAWSSR